MQVILVDQTLHLMQIHIMPHTLLLTEQKAVLLLLPMAVLLLRMGVVITDQ